MKTLLPLVSLACMLTSYLAAQNTKPEPDGTPDWENQAIFRINKERPHAIKMPFPDAKSAQKRHRLESPWCLSLNGTWRLHWSPTPEGIPSGFQDPSFDDHAWTLIPVPANVELHGHGVPLYSNISYPFLKDPPRVTGAGPGHWTSHELRNPVSCYRRSFEVPKKWKDRAVFITFHGVSSAFYLYINGHKVGYSQDSRTPAEFNITPYLKSKEPNTLAVEVYRYSDGSYLEDQDFWRLSGIFRDVILWSADKLDIRDYEVRPKLSPDLSQGLLSVDLDLCNQHSSDLDCQLELTLLDPTGRQVSQMERHASAKANSEAKLTFAFPEIPAVQAWSAESPSLYKLLLHLKNTKGKTIACYSQAVGFRTSRILNGNLLINNQPVLIKGVNRHDHNPITGHYVTEADMREDLLAMKRLNINAVRTSHYPNDPRFLELCDELGLYVVSEANIESHGMGYKEQSLAKDPTWGPAHLDRVVNMVEAFKNHPSVVLWSLGNEAGDGVNFESCSEWVHSRDASRPVHYEQGAMGKHVDLFSPMYFGIDAMEPWARNEERKLAIERRPLIQCEFNHTMGNSGGGFDEYWRIIRAEPLLQGGFVWDWKDQGLLQLNQGPLGTSPFFAYGGDFGDYPNDDNFCCNGIVGPDLKPNPHAVEVAHQYRDILVEPIDLKAKAPRLRIRSERFFTPLSGTPFSWSLTEDGVEVLNGRALIPECGPLGQVEWTAPTESFQAKPTSEYHLTLRFEQGRDTAWGSQNRVICTEQVQLPWGTRDLQVSNSTKPGKIQLSEGTLKETKVSFVSTADTCVAISEANGSLLSLRIKGVEQLAKPLRPEFWRAPTDNDKGAKLPNLLAIWKEAGGRCTVSNRTVMEASGTTTLKYDLEIPAGKSRAELSYQFRADGSIQVTFSLLPAGEKLPMIPRLGMTLALRAELDTWTWFGRGPGENYRDRFEGCPVGIYSGKVGDLWHPYIEPQETANRTDIRWTQFVDKHGKGLRFKSADTALLEVAALPFDQADLEQAKHASDLIPRNHITVQLSHLVMGVGGENSWGAWPRPHVRIPADHRYTYSFTIEPLR